MLQENVSPGNASSTYTGISCPALNVVFRPWVLSKVERRMSACGTSLNLYWCAEPILVLCLCGFLIMSGAWFHVRIICVMLIIYLFYSSY